MLWHMVEHPAGWQLPAWSALIAVASDAGTAAAAVQSGADVIDLSDAPQAQITAFRTAHPAVPYCANQGSADIVTDQRTAAATGAWLICPDLPAARLSGLPQHQLLVAASPAGIPPLTAAGWHVVVDVDLHGGQYRPGGPTPLDPPGQYRPGGPTPLDPAGPPQAGVVAAAALSCWLGAAAVRTSQPAPVRQALDMTASIRGLRPPARTVRGLA
jgi:hypothetical protein